MGYTHYFRTNRKAFGETEYNQWDKVNYPTSKEFREKRKQFTDAVYKICKEADTQGIALGNGSGNYYPVMGDNRVSLNGSTQQPSNKWVHSKNPVLDNNTDNFANKLAKDLGAGVSIFSQSNLQRPSDTVELDFTKQSKHVDNRFAGALLTVPSVPNNDNKPYVDASYESLFIPAYIDEDNVEKEDRKFGCTKTNYYPYDVVVTAVLITLYVIFGKEYVKISSDGYKKDRVAGGLLAKKAADIDRYQFYLEGEEHEDIVSNYKDFYVSHASNSKYNNHAIDKSKPKEHEYKGNKYNLYFTSFVNESSNKNYLYYEKA